MIEKGIRAREIPAVDGACRANRILLIPEASAFSQRGSPARRARFAAAGGFGISCRRPTRSLRSVLAMINPTRVLVLLAALLAMLPACEEQKQVAPAQASGSRTPDGASKRYAGVGVITKINDELGSIELDHETIEGFMPAMRMEWYAKERALLDGVKVGDKVDFTVEEAAGRQYLVAIKAKPKS
jgi:Cu(I)/Ag(I) efflux system protein CusF